VTWERDELLETVVSLVLCYEMGCWCRFFVDHGWFHR
jgi:hypothetical protein